MNLQLRPSGKDFTATEKLGEDVAIYEVTGLAPTDSCLISKAGIKDGKRRWSLLFYRSGLKLSIDQGPYDSPEIALETVREFFSRENQ